MEENQSTEPKIFSRGEAKSAIPAIPRGNNIIVAMSYQNIGMGIKAQYDKDTKYSQSQLTKPTYKIIGYGENVKGLNIGDNVTITSAPDTIVNVDSNKQSIDYLGRHFSEMSSEEYSHVMMKRFDVVDYGVFSEYVINIILL